MNGAIIIHALMASFPFNLRQFKHRSNSIAKRLVNDCTILKTYLRIICVTKTHL